MTLWTESYEREIKDVFRVQEDIARSIAGSLRLTLGDGAAARLSSGEPRSLKAHDLYLRARFYYNKYTESDRRRSLALYRQTLDGDSACAPAWAGMADSWSALAHDYLPPKEAYPEARAAAQRAIALDPTLAEAHACLGLVLQGYDWDFAAAEREYLRAITLHPNAALAYRYYSYVLLATPTRLDSGLSVLRRAESLDPLSAWGLADLCWVLQLMGQYDEAIDECRKAIELDPHSQAALGAIGQILLRAGRPEEAFRVLGRAEDPPPQLRAVARTLITLGRRAEARRLLRGLERDARRRYVRPEAVASIYVALGEHDAAFRWLELAYQARSAGVGGLRVEPGWAPIRSNPHFAALVKKSGIP